MTIEFIESIKELDFEQKFYVNKETLVEIYRVWGRPKGRIVIIKNIAFISLEINTNAQFILKGIKNNNEIDFIEEKETIILDDHDKNFFEFILLEVMQGKTFVFKLLRFIQIVSLTALFNMLILMFASEKNISMICTSLLSAVSVFVAIFSVFTANQHHFDRAEKYLFENGKIAYYFSVDRNLTMSGLIAIFAALFGIILTQDSDTPFSSNHLNNIFQHNFISRKGLLILFANTAFLMTYITLRSLIEFYVKRPAEYQIGLMKDRFLNS